MALTGLEIYKLLPKKNCGECGPPTCLAFAMSLAAGKASLDTCPYVTDDAKEALGSASAPPIKLVKIGAGEKVIELGDETVIFRHDKTFFHPTGIAFEVEDSLNEVELTQKLSEINTLEFNRVGLQYEVDMVAVKQTGDAAQFKQTVEKVAAGTKLALVLITEDPVAAGQALEVCKGRNPLLYAATESNYNEMTELAKKHNVPLGIKAEDIFKLSDLAEKIIALGHKDLVLDSGARGTAQVLADLTQMRRATIKKKYRPFGYPTVAFTTAEDPMEEMLQAQVYISKYASMVVLKNSAKHFVLPLLSWRQNLYTDPQKPIQVESKIYEVGNVTADSPVYLTTNFSLTYYSVEGEVEGSKIPAYIIPVGTDGTSVLTAWAAGKFSAEKIAEVINEIGIADKVNHREIILPGYVAVLSGKLEEKSGWKVIVGPREAAGISAFAKSRYGK
ncbi:MAG: acetyl-CoA decarbonylase/synthase complex subunit gamma [Peptococcaceae bacterium BICA1-8]|nr:MAG: acetyl-CoA decarbonylase/synthase complex subunit gamma [Peptococcaceae bacterium BICA1-8]